MYQSPSFSIRWIELLVTSFISTKENVCKRKELYHIVTAIIFKSADTVALILFLCQTGVRDNQTGEYIISLPSWSRAVYYKGARIEYEHKQNIYDDSIIVDGPTKVPLEIVVRTCFELVLIINIY